MQLTKRQLLTGLAATAATVVAPYVPPVAPRINATFAGFDIGLSADQIPVGTTFTYVFDVESATPIKMRIDDGPWLPVSPVSAITASQMIRDDSLESVTIRVVADGKIQRI